MTQNSGSIHIHGEDLSFREWESNGYTLVANYDITNRVYNDIQYLCENYDRGRNKENYEDTCDWSVLRLYESGRYREFGYFVMYGPDMRPVMGSGIVRHDKWTVIGGHRTIIVGNVSASHAIGTGFMLPSQRNSVSKLTEFWITLHSGTRDLYDVWKRLRFRQETSGKPFALESANFIRHVEVLHDSFMLNNVDQRILKVSPYESRSSR